MVVKYTLLLLEPSSVEIIRLVSQVAIFSVRSHRKQVWSIGTRFRVVKWTLLLCFYLAGKALCKMYLRGYHNFILCSVSIALSFTIN